MSGGNQSYYRAMTSKDRRFDGRFFVGVKTTGIYCRPICPARTPLLKNIDFYRSAAEAEAAGFRPCKRCRPESAPGTPAWAGTSSTVSRALKLISRGIFGEQNIGALAEALGVSERRLRQLFEEHLGASPGAVARTKRLDLARQLIDDSALPLADVAFKSGFQSIRRFNEAVKARFGASPRELRNRRSGQRPQDFLLKLPLRPPFHWEALLGFLKGRATPGVESVEDETYRRSVAFGEAKGWIEVKLGKAGDQLELRCFGLESVPLMELLDRTRTLFDLEADPHLIANHLSKFPELAPAIAAFPGLRVAGGWDGFELAVRTILGQQVTVKAATTIMGRVVERLGEPVPKHFPAGLTHFFPSAEVMATARLENIGMPAARVEALKGLARKVVNEGLVLDGTAEVESTLLSLLKIKGVGPWTAQYLAMRALRQPDAFPASDLILKRVLDATGEGAVRSQAWGPWRAYAAIYLWKWEAEKGKGNGG